MGVALIMVPPQMSAVAAAHPHHAHLCNLATQCVDSGLSVTQALCDQGLTLERKQWVLWAQVGARASEGKGRAQAGLPVGWETPNWVLGLALPRLAD